MFPVSYDLIQQHMSFAARSQNNMLTEKEMAQRRENLDLTAREQEVQRNNIELEKARLEVEKERMEVEELKKMFMSTLPVQPSQPVQPHVSTITSEIAPKEHQV